MRVCILPARLTTGNGPAAAIMRSGTDMHQSLDLPSAIETHDKNLPPSSRSGGARYIYTIRHIKVGRADYRMGKARHIKRERARGSVWPKGSGASRWTGGQAAGGSICGDGCMPRRISLAFDGRRDGPLVRASRVSAASHHFPSSQLLSRSTESQFKRAEAIMRIVVMRRGYVVVHTARQRDGAGRQAGKAGKQAIRQARPNRGRPVDGIIQSAHPRCGHRGPIAFPGPLSLS